MKKTGTGEMIRERREELQISQAELARRVGIKQPSLHNIENGKTKRSRYLPEIFNALGIDQRGPGGFSGGQAVGGGSFDVGARSNRDFPVYYMRPVTGGGPALLSAEAIDYVERPALLATVRDSFGICVCGDEMYPAYKAGDIVFVHPYQPPVVGSDIVLRPTSGDDMRIMIGMLESETATEWKVIQYRLNNATTLNKSEWGRVDCIVGKYNRR